MGWKIGSVSVSGCCFYGGPQKIIIIERANTITMLTAATLRAYYFYKIPAWVFCFLLLMVVGLLWLVSLPSVYYLIHAPKEQIVLWYAHAGVLLVAVRGLIIPVLYGLLIFLMPRIVWMGWKGLYVLGQTFKGRVNQTSAFSKYLLLVISVALLLTVAEVVLHHKGYVPGKYIYNGFAEVDSLIEYKGMICDSEGIFKVDPEVGVVMEGLIQEALKQKAPEVNMNFKGAEFGGYRLANDYLAVLNGMHQNHFSSFLQKIETKSQRSAFDSAVWQYAHHPINEEGFRSIPFKKIKAAKPSVLILGDSYAWGDDTQNKTNSFADHLLTQGYVVYNTGIGSTDLPQYVAVAKKYIPLLKPDVVVLNFNLENDVSYYPRKPEAAHPMVWVTNAGYLMSSFEGIPFANMQEAYRFYTAFSYIPLSSLLNKICSRTVIGTLIWASLASFLPLDKHPEEAKAKDKLAATLKREVPLANEEVEELKKLCADHHTALVFVTIPALMREYLQYRFVYTRDYPNLFEGDKTEAFVPSFPETCYTHGNTHFNDTGHPAYALYLQHIIDSLVQTKALPVSSR